MKNKIECFFATYDKDTKDLWFKYDKPKLVARYWDDVEIYEVKEIDDCKH